MEGLSPVVLKLLSDRSFESRKKGAHEVEVLCRRLREINGRDAIRKMVTTLSEDFALAGQPNQRKGGLIGLASCAIGLGSLTVEHLPAIMPAVLKNFSDPEPRVRYYACESLFNVTKICRSAMLPYFPDIFASVCKLAADVDNDVKSGAGLYDRLLKEVVLETAMEGEARGISRGGIAGGASGAPNAVFDVGRFVAMLRAHMGVANPYVRQLLVGWIGSLLAVPALDMLDYVECLLEGLFDMLADGNREIRQGAYTTLAEFLDDMRRVPYAEIPRRLRFAPMVDTLVVQTSRDRDKFNRLTAVEWLGALVGLGQGLLAPVLPRIVGAALHCLSDPEAEIVNDASKLNAELSRLVRAILMAQHQQQQLLQQQAAAAAAIGDGGAGAAPALPDGFASSSSSSIASLDASALIAAVSREVASPDKTTRLAALRWTALLLALCPDAVMATIDGTLPALAGNLSDSSDPELLKLNLEVLARLCATDPRFLDARVLPEVVRMFGADRSLLEARGSFILRRLCLLLDGELVFLGLARILGGERNREFASLVVELLSLILLTSAETRDLREMLRGCAAAFTSMGAGGATTEAAQAGDDASLHSASDPSSASGGGGAGWVAFQQLYHTWVVNPVATLALCLHVQAYELGAALVGCFADVTVTVGVLMQCDKLVQLLESPLFITLRMHLAQPGRPGHGALMRALYGLLMILPQGSAYTTLRDRLTAVAPLCYGTPQAHTALGGALPKLHPAKQDLFLRFQSVQAAYQASLAADTRSRSLLQRQGSTGVITGSGAAKPLSVGSRSPALPAGVAPTGTSQHQGSMLQQLEG